MGNTSALDKRREAKIEKQQEKIKTLIKVSKKIASPKTNYTVKATLYSDEPREHNTARPWYKYGYGWYPATHTNFDVKVKGDFPTESVNRLLTHVAGKEIDDLYTTARKIMTTSGNFRKIVERGYIQAIYIHSYDMVNPTRKYKPREEQLRSVDISVYHRYVHTPVDIEKETLRDAVRKQEYVENECWINAITDNYQNLFQHTKSQEKLS